MGDEKRLGFIVTAKDLASKEFRSINGEIVRMEKTTKGAKTGLGGLLSTMNPLKVGLLGAAAGATALFGAGVKVTGMAIDEEKNVAKLTASLQANIPAWNGNTDAIEKTISKREALAFTDDDLRDSMAKLVAVTHDVDKAFEVQSTAMDLARFKGISLEAATEALTKVEAGQFRILKSLGIQLPKNATATEALAAVQKIVFGQAKAYANTTAGKLEAGQIRINDAMEELGAEILPRVVTALDALTANERLGSIGESIDNEIAQGLSLTQTKAALEKGISDLAVPGFIFGGDAARASEELKRQLAEVNAAMADLSNDWREDGRNIKITYQNVVGASAKAERDIRRDAKAMADHITDWKDSVVADGQAVIDDYYDPLEDRAELAATNAEINKQRMIIASTTATDAQIADAQRALTGLERDQGSYLLELAAAGKSGSATFQAGYNDILQRMKTAQGSELAMLKALKRELDLLIGKVYQAQAALINLRTSAPGYYNSEKTGYASGGYVPAFGTYDVGEAGRERITMFPGGGAYVTPNSSSGSSSSSSSSGASRTTAARPAAGGVTIQINSMFPPRREDIRELARLIDAELYSAGQRAVPTVIRT